MYFDLIISFFVFCNCGDVNFGYYFELLVLVLYKCLFEEDIVLLIDLIDLKLKNFLGVLCILVEYYCIISN